MQVTVLVVAGRRNVHAWVAGTTTWTPPGIPNPTFWQYIINTVAVDFGFLYVIIGPLLFLPAARGSLINAFLGVRYGTMIKWHRCAVCKFKGFCAFHSVNCRITATPRDLCSHPVGVVQAWNACMRIP